MEFIDSTLTHVVGSIQVPRGVRVVMMSTARGQEGGYESVSECMEGVYIATGNHSTLTLPFVVSYIHVEFDLIDEKKVCVYVYYYS